MRARPSLSVGPMVRSVLRRLPTVLAVIVLLAVLLSPLYMLSLSWVGRAEAAQPSPAARATEKKSSSLDDLRTMPLEQYSTTIEREFPDGEGLDDETKVRTVVQQMSVGMGQPDLAEAIFDGLEAMGENGGSGEQATTYPYHYPDLEQVAAIVTPAVARAHGTQLIELANLMVRMSAAVDPGTDRFQTLAWGAPVADILLRPVAEGGGCDARLTLAWVVAMGEGPDVASYDALFAKAVQACPGDPTARWLWGQRQVVDGSPGMNITYNFRLGRGQLMARPIAFFDRWVQDEPASVLAHAGLADAYLSQALVAENARRMPFTVRNHATRAAAEYIAANRLEPAPSLELGAFEAKTLLGGSPALPAIPASEQTVDVLRAIGRGLEKEHDFDRAAVVDQVNPAPAPPSQIRFQGLANSFLLPSIGLSSSRPALLNDKTSGEYGGGTVDWLGFIPDYRSDDSLWDAGSLQCRGQAAQRNLVLAGEIDQALQVDTSSDGQNCFFAASDLALFARDGVAETVTADQMQNLYRYGHEWDKAQQVVDTWRGADGDPQATKRAGELAFLADDFAAAVTLFEESSQTPATSEGGDCCADDGSWTQTKADEASLMLGLARERTGDPDGAVDAYGLAAESTSDDTAAAAEARLGTIASSRRLAASAIEHYRAAVAHTHEAEDSEIPTDPLDTRSSSGAELNNLAVALLDQDKEPAEALRMARLALPHDPQSPVFRDTLAQALEANGKTGAATREYVETSKADKTAYQTQNNLGVQRAKAGERSSAIKHLELAVAAKPDYALAWFNLGVVQAHGGGLSGFVRSQAAMAKAVRLDSGLRGASQTLVPDRSAVSTGLDISRAVPSSWKFSAAETPMQGMTLLVVVLAAWRLAFALGGDVVLEKGASRVFGLGRARRPALARAWTIVDRRLPLSVAIIAAVAIGVWPFVGQDTPTALALVVVLATVASLVWLFGLVGGRHRIRSRRGWVPGVAFGAVTSALGFAFVPVPVVDEADETHASWLARWGGVVLVALFGAACMGAALLTGLPLLRLAALVCLAMVSAAMLPLRPFDGGFVRTRLVGAITGVGLLAVSGAMALNLI